MKKPANQQKRARFPMAALKEISTFHLKLDVGLLAGVISLLGLLQFQQSELLRLTVKLAPVIFFVGGLVLLGILAHTSLSLLTAGREASETLQESPLLVVLMVVAQLLRNFLLFGIIAGITLRIIVENATTLGAL